MTQENSNKPVILITGASSGIGAATASLFAAEGYRVALAARRADRLHALAETIQATGGEALVVPTDVSRLDQIQHMVETTLAHFGQIDVLFNNAGFGRLKQLTQLDPVQDIESQLQVNLWGLIQTTRAVLPHMIDRHSGHIINMSSVAGWVALPMYSVYAASKFAVRGFTDALRREVKGYGIHVSGIYPGPVRTEFELHTGTDQAKKFSTPHFLEISAEETAAEVLKLVKRPRRGVVVPRLMLVAVWAEIVFPGLVDAIVRRFSR